MQLAIAIPRLWMVGADHSFQTTDQQALTSLGGFLIGSLLGRLSFAPIFGSHGARSRAWLVASSIGMALLMLVAACVLIRSGDEGIALNRDNPSWTNVQGFLALAFLSASVGLQGATAARLSTPFATTGAWDAEPSLRALCEMRTLLSSSRFRLPAELS